MLGRLVVVGGALLVGAACGQHGGAAPPDARVDTAADAGASPCPPQMARVAGTFCIDRFEAALEEQQGDGSWRAASPYLVVGARTVRAVPADGIVPQGYISGAEAATACAASGKRLCTTPEWLAACRGPQGHVWPYGDVHDPTACNDGYVGSPVASYFHTSTGVWDAAHMNDPGINQQPGTVAPGGQFARCKSDWGVYDLHGNLHEWTAGPSGAFHGGFYADAKLNGPGCSYVTTAHAFGYHDYSTGFRCCADR